MAIAQASVEHDGIDAEWPTASRLSPSLTRPTKTPTIRAACSATSPAPVPDCAAPGGQSSLAPASSRSRASLERPAIAPRARPPTPSETPEPETPPATGDEHGGVEDLAWAGVAVAAEAATLGVRLLSRAVEAVRKPADRG